ncbi:MAG: LysR family transcriptional regulator [Acetobacteraceae bacterium]
MSRSDIDLLALRGFCLLLEERSVSRAAARLGIRQSAMSRQLGRLRAYFADPLLVWAGGTMVPTPRALALADEIRRTAQTLERLATPKEAFDPASTVTTLTLACTGYTEEVFLAGFLSAVSARAPGVTVNIRLPDRIHDTGALEHGEIDFLIGWTTDPPPILRSRLLFSDKLVCIARSSHPVLRSVGDLTFPRYLELPHVQYDIPGKTTSVRLLHERLAREGRQRPIRFHVQSPGTVAEVVATSDLIATLPGRFAARCLERYALRVFEVPLDLPPVQNCLYWHECMHCDPRSRWFRRLFKELAAEIRPSEGVPRANDARGKISLPACGRAPIRT